MRIYENVNKQLSMYKYSKVSILNTAYSSKALTNPRVFFSAGLDKKGRAKEKHNNTFTIWWKIGWQFASLGFGPHFSNIVEMVEVIIQKRGLRKKWMISVTN